MNFRRLLSTALAALSLVSARAEQVVFSELMYQPPTGKPEFIEIWNITATPLDMARWKFDDGITFAFPEFAAGSPQAHLLQPFERIVVSSGTPAATRAAYPTIPGGVRVFGPWAGSLANEGERVTLMDKNSVVVCTVEYGDAGRWPIAPDGAGHSLVLANENKTIDDWRVWRASTQNGGSAGIADPAPPATGITLNEVHFGATGRVDWIEVRNDSRTTTMPAGSLFVASKNDFSDKVALSGNITPGAVLSVNVDFAANNDAEVKLYLIDGSNHVRDAIKITRKVGRDCWQEFPAGSGDWFNGTSDTRDAQNNPARNTDIVINEIMADPPSNQRDGEFVELYNRGTEAVNIGGWKLKEGVNFTIPAGTLLQPGAYLVIGANAEWLNANYTGISALGNWEGQLANSGEMLKLDDENGNLVSSVDYRFGGEWPEQAAGNGSSLELVNPHTDNTIGGAWKDSDESQKSTFQNFSINGGTYQRGNAGGTTDDEIRIWGVSDTHIILKNIVLRPTTGGTNLLVNGAVTTLNNNNVDGWQSRGTHADTFHDAEGVHLVADGHGDNKCNHMEKDAVGMQANVGYTLEFQARWVSGKNRLVTQTWDTSWGGINLVPIPSNLGTPGAANSRLAANPAAQITALRHSPAVPAQGQTVTVTARVSSLTPLQTVQVFHRLDTIAGTGAFNSTLMSDNGTGGDAAANDGIYTAQIIPANFGYTSGAAVVEFYVRATASNGAVAELPRKGTAAPGLWAVGSPGSSDLRRMRIVISSRWLNALDQNSGTGGHTVDFNYKYPRLSARYFPCVFIHNDTDIYYNSSVRKTGSPFTRQTDSNLVRGRVVMPGDNLFRGKTRMYWDNDGGTSMLHNRITRYWLYLMGVPGNENEFCRVARNGAGYTVRETNEVFDKDMLNRIWENGSDGQFYEMDDKFWIADDGSTRLANQDGTWGYKSGDSQGAENPTAYHNQFVPKSRENEYDYSAFIEFTKQLTTNGGGLTFEQMERMADSRTMTAYAAVRGYIGDWDTITGRRGKNGYMYQRSTDRKWTFLHWDSDLAFSSTGEAVLGTLQNIPTYFNRPYNKRQLNYFLTEMMNAYNANGGRLNAWLDAEENASTAYVANKGTYQTWSSGRASAIQSFLGAAFTANFLATSPSSGSTTALNTITVSGSAPSTGYRVECVGQPNATLNWVSESNWSLAGIVLKTGVNSLVFRMVDMYGDPVGAPINYTINKTGATPPIAALISSPSSGNVALGEILKLDATGSFDPDAAGALTYTWSVSPSTGVSVSAPTPAKRDLIFHVPGTYTVTVEVTDAEGQVGTINRVFNVHSSGDFDAFTGDYLTGYTIANAELRDNYSPNSWYSLNETDGHLVVQVLDTVPRPLTNTAPAFPLFTKAVPASADFALQTDFSFETRQFGSFLSGLWLETLEGGVPVKYAFGLENGATFKLFRSFNNGAFSVQVGSSAYAGGPMTIRILRQALSLQFQRLVNGAWVTVASRPFANPITAVNGGIFVAAGSTSPLLTQSARVAFDYLFVTDPGHSSDLVQNLRLTEIMYNPSSGGVEFLEVQNVGATPLDVTGAYFEASLPWDAQFTFPSLILEPGQFCVVTNNALRFRELYGESIVVAGEAVGGLANDTEQVVLRDASSNIVFDVTYLDSWHPATDGGGKSLDLLTTDPTLYENASAWKPSDATGGSPGFLVAASITQHPVGDQVNPGEPFSLEAGASGTPAPSYQWRKNGQPIPGATAATYSVASATENDQGDYDVVAQNAGPAAISNVAVVSVNDPVAFAPHPASQGANSGAIVTFTVGVTGTGPFTYQWRKGGQILADETEATLTVVANEGTVGTYDVIVTNIVGPATSNPAMLTLNQAVTITTHPMDQTVNPGEEASFSVEVTGTGPFTYEWRKDGETIAGATQAELTFIAQEDAEGTYDVIVSNVVGPVPSNEATLAVNDPVEITAHPQPISVDVGGLISLSVSATGSDPLSYQWWKGTQVIDGATNSILEIPGANVGHAGDYHVVVTNPVGSVISNSATVSVNASVPAQIVVQPRPQVVLVGGRATFSVEAAGTGPLNYQWRKGENDIAGATGPTYQIQSVTASDAGQYDVVVSNATGTETSVKVALSFLDWKQAAGRYQGVLEGPDLADPASNPLPGRVTITLTKKGKFTGVLEYFGLKHSFRGTFDINLSATTSATRKGQSAVGLTVSLDGVAKSINITAAHPGGPEYNGDLPQIPKRTRSTPAALAGRYTLLLQPETGAPPDLTAPGYAAVKVAANGAVTWVGKLPDSTKLKGSAWLTPDNSAAFYSALYVKKVPAAGHIAGPLDLTSTTADAPLFWRKPPQDKGTFWTGGFSTLVEGAGWRYSPPANGAKVIALATPRLTLVGPIAGGSFSRLVTMTAKNTFQVDSPNLEKIKLKVNRGTGVFTGSYFDASASKTRKLEGVTVQPQNRAFGFFLGDTNAGTWELVQE